VVARAGRVAWLHRRLLFQGPPENLLHKKLLGLYSPGTGEFV